MPAYNNAGIEDSGKATTDCAEQDFNRTIAVNVTGVWLCMKSEIHRMLGEGSGAIVNTASAAGLVEVQLYSSPNHVPVSGPSLLSTKPRKFPTSSNLLGVGPEKPAVP